MLLEAQKYESQVFFLMSEREMLLIAQKENSEDFDEKTLDFMRKSAVAAEEKRIKLDEDIT